jgi:hypothetical protein
MMRTSGKLGKLKHDVALTNCWPNQGGLAWPATFPAGTPCILVGSAWAIRYATTVAELTGNTHDAYHRHVWIDEATVDSNEEVSNST